MATNPGGGDTDSVARIEQAITRGTNVAVIGTGLTAVLVLITLGEALSGAGLTWIDGVAAVLALLALVQVGLGIQLRRAGVAARTLATAAPHAVEAEPPAQMVSDALLNRWKTMRTRVWLAFAQGRDRPESYLRAGWDLIGLLNGLSNKGELTPLEVANRDMAAAALSSYRFLVPHTALGWASWLLDNHAEHDATAFGAVMEIIQTVSAEGALAADAWIDLARQAGAAKLGSQARDGWGRFRDPANLMINDLNSLVHDTFLETGSNIPYRQELIREI